MPLVDKPDTELAEKAWLNQATIRLYDPPVDGKTPSDGAGFPRTSACYLRDKTEQIALGFTTDVVGWDERWQTLGDFPVRPEATFVPQQEVKEEAVKVPRPSTKAKVTEKVRAVVKGKKDRKRTVKR